MRYLLAIILTVVSVGSLFAQHRFVENKGQLPDQVKYKCKLSYGSMFLESDGLVYNFADKSQHEHSHAHHGESDIEESHHELDHHHDLPTHLDFHAYKVEFVGSSFDVKISGDRKCTDYENYFIGNNPSNWASNVSKYERVMYSELYSGIDLCFYDNGGGLKYDIIVAPYANPDAIKLAFEGVDGLKLRRGNLIIETSVSTTTEMRPTAFQIIDGDSLSIECEYVLEDSMLTYFFPRGYDPDVPLIIDPSLVFSTYSGSTGDNWGFTATWDYDDNVFAGGIVFDVGYPVSLGAYQTDMAGGVAPNPLNPGYYGNGCDVGIIKYSSDGVQKLYATYLGGATGEEMPHSMVVNENNELIVFGTTGSSDFPTTFSAYDPSFNGGTSITYDNVIAFPQGTDIYVAKLSEDGTQLLGGTYLGGSSNDGLNFKTEYTLQGYIQMHGNDSLYYNYGDGARGEVITDLKNYIYVGANTFSNDIMPGMNSGEQTTNAGGMDGLVAKFTPNLSQLIWMSYLGGSNDDAIYSISPDNSYNVLVAGGTCSSDFPTSGNAFESTFQGGSTDAFVSKINQNGNVLMGSTFFGSSEYDQAHFVRVDDDNLVYIYGQTEAPGSTLIYNVGYSVPNSGQMLACFENDLSDRIWSTVFGRGAGHPVLSPSAFTVDVCNRIYLAGWGREWPYTYLDETNAYYTWEDDFGTKGLPVTADALESETDGQDFYIMVLSENAASLEYATFFGEQHYNDCGYSGHDHVDGGTSRFDNKGNVIQSVCASCGSCQEFPTIPNPGVWSNTNNSSNCNNAVFKINIIENLAESNFDPIPAFCAPLEVHFVNNSQGVSYTWDFGDGSPQSNEYEPVHLYNEEGVYEVMLVAYDPAACNYADTSYREVEVQIAEIINLPKLTLCPGESIQIGPDGEYDDDVSFLWVGDDLNSNTVQNPIASPNQPSEYQLVIQDVCVDTVFQQVDLYISNLAVSVSPDTMICPGGYVDLTAYPEGDFSSIQWSNNPSFTNILGVNENLIVSPDENTTYWVQISENQCDFTVEASVNVAIHNFQYQLDPSPIICLGDTTVLNIVNLNSSDIVNYTWSPISEIDSGEDTDTPVVSPDVNTVFTVQLENQMGCQTTAQIQVIVDNIQMNPPFFQNPLCFGDCTGSIAVSANGYPPYDFLWDNGLQSDQVEGLCAGNYYVTVTDSIGCKSNMQIEIEQPTAISPFLSEVVQPECDGVGLGSATAGASGGVGWYSYVWDDGTINNQNTFLQTGLSTVVITDVNGCDTSISVNMVAPSDLATLLENIVNNPCYGDCFGEMSVSVSGGTPPFNYYWSNDETTQSLSQLCTGNYTVTIIDSENCVIHQNGYISQPLEIVSEIVAEHPIMCFGESTSIEVSVSGGVFPYSYSWNNGSEDISIEEALVGNYSVTLTDDHGCTDTLEIMLTQPELLKFEDSVINMTCEGVCNGRIIITATGGTQPYVYSWSEANSDSVLDNLCVGNYEMLITDSHNCETYGEFFVESDSYVPPLEVTTDNPAIYVGMSTHLFGTDVDGYTYLWSPSESLVNNDLSQVQALPTETTTYELKIIDSIGCVNVDTITISVYELICGEPYLYVPNAFTPNDDGENDFFKPYAPFGVIREMYFAVYDRWGELMYETDNIYDKGWDGSYKGKKLPPDVYVFYFDAICIDDDNFIKKGNVTLLR